MFCMWFKDNLEFDHTDRTKKSFSLTGCYLDKSWNKVLEEFKKCTLLCTGCHKKKTKLYKDYPDEPWNKNKGNSQFIHGTARMYSEKKCRCVFCRKAKSLYRNKKIDYLEEIPDVERKKLIPFHKLT